MRVMEVISDGLRQWADSPSRIFLSIIIAFLCGVSVQAILERPLSWSGVAAMIALGALMLALVAKLPRLTILICTMLFAAALGLWRADTVWCASLYAAPASTPIAGQQFTGTVVAFERVRPADTQLDADDITMDTGQPVPGRARLYIQSPLPYIYGDQIAWSCKPAVVAATNQDGWQERLLLDGVRWTCGVFSSPRIIAHQSGSPILVVLYRIKHFVIASVQRIFPEPEASFLLGLLIGADDGLPSSLTDAFRATGTTHILAVSGYNVTQLINVGVLLLALFLVPRRKSSAVMAVTIIIFACIVGGDASVVRAAIMGCVGILATLYARRYSGLRALVLAAALMLAINPLVLRHDVGFQLSFAAVVGLHVLAPRLQNLCPPRWRNWLTLTISETTAATLATAPIILHTFGYLSAVSLLANLLILPLIPWAMMFGALATAFGWLSATLALVPAFVAACIMRLAEWLALTCARLFPFMWRVQIGATSMFIMYVCLLMVIYILSRRSMATNK